MAGNLPLQASMAETRHIRQRFADTMTSLAMGLRAHHPQMDGHVLEQELAHAAYLWGASRFGSPPDAPCSGAPEVDDYYGVDPAPDFELAQGTPTPLAKGTEQTPVVASGESWTTLHEVIKRRNGL